MYVITYLTYCNHNLSEEANIPTICPVNLDNITYITYKTMIILPLGQVFLFRFKSDEIRMGFMISTLWRAHVFEVGHVRRRGSLLLDP